MGSSGGLPVLSKPFRHEDLEAVLAQLRQERSQAPRRSAEAAAGSPS
jgi:hypothetical protein